MPGNGHFAWLADVFVLTMTAALLHKPPSVALN
jgi:hypothetical protein